MVAIPQITRDRLVSSAVGTPGVDTSGQEMENSLAKSANEVGAAAADYAITRQQQVDTAEANRLSLGYKMNVMNTYEQMKQQYATNPEAMGPAFMQSMQDHLGDAQEQSSNPRVNLMVGRGDPQFDGYLVRQQQQWSLMQRETVDKGAVIQQGNQLANTAENIAADATTPYALKKQNLLPLFNAAGNLTAGAFASAHPASALELSQRIGPTIMTRAVYGMMKANPAQAVQFTQEPEVQKAFESNPKELETLHNAAVDRLKGLASEEKWNIIAAPLVDSPDVVRDVASGKVDWTALDQLPQNAFTAELKKMALDVSPKNVEEQQQAISEFYDRAAKIGVGIKGTPPERSVADLVNFSTDLAKAYNGGLITKSTYERLNKQLAAPLIGAVTKAHDPNMFEKAVNRVGSWFQQHPENPEDVVDKYTGGYNVINKWLDSTGNSQDWRAKSGIIQKYLDMSDKIGPNDRDAQGRQYTPQTVAQKVMGIAVGDTVTTPLGPLVITGHKSDGMPIFKLTKEQQDKFDHLKAVKGQ